MAHNEDQVFGTEGVYQNDLENGGLMTPEEVLAMQWAEFEREAQGAARGLWQRGANGAALLAELQALWQTRGGDTEDYLLHQEELNNILGQANAIPFPWTLSDSSGY